MTRIVVNGWPNWRSKPSRFRAAIAVLFHLLTAFAPFVYRSLEFFLFLCTTYLILQFGLVLGYHRLLSHRCFTTHVWLKRCFTLLGVLAMQTGPISWIATHRMHHQMAERELDPHTPKHGLTWSHFVWTLFEHPRLKQSDNRVKIAHDLHSDPFIRFCEEKFIFLNAAATASIFLAGVGVGGLSRGFSFLVWIVALRTVCLWHITFLTNSMGHTFGYRNFNTSDDSQNVWLLGILALGDGWHNNHHAFPACAAHGRRWFEVDVTYWLIVILERVGLAWNVRHPDRYKARP
ncbi:MAG TPA: fatty acid desaturase [Candidatus Angelobacter sp.]